MNEDIKNSGDTRREDAILIKAFLKGDKVAFDKLVVKYTKRVFNVCFRLLGDYEEANDSAQDTFIKVYRALRKFRFEASFSTWLYRIAVNTCKNKLKSVAHRQKKRVISWDNPVSADRPPVLEIQDERQSPAIELEKKERMKFIQEAINVLPPEHKEVITLRDIEGLSYEEIAEITGLSLGTVKSRLARARSDLRKRLRSVI